MNSIIKENLTEHFNKSSSFPFLFIGSGFSRRYLGLDNWEGLLRRFCKGLKDYEYYRSKANVNYPHIASLISEDFHEHWWTSSEYLTQREGYKDYSDNLSSPLKIAISEHMKKHSCECCVNEIYKEEIKALSKLEVDGIITTNWDLFLETLFPDYKVFVGQRELFLSNPLSICEIYKIHGCCSQPNSLVLTDSDYSDFNSKNAYLAAKLITIFVEHPIVFIGYSVEDPNIKSILSSIVNCLKPNDVTKIRDNLIFVKRKKDNSSEEISNSYVYVAGSSIPIKLVTTNDFTPIYEAIAGTERKIPVKYLRYCKENFCEIIKDKNPEKKLYALDYEKLGNAENVEFVVGVGVISDFASMKGYTLLNYEDLLSFYFNGEKYKTDLILEKTLPILLKKTMNLPVFKFLHNAGINTNSDFQTSVYYGELRYRVYRNPEKFKGGKSLENEYERKAKGKSMQQIIDSCTPEKATVYIPFVDWSSIDTDILEKFLKENFKLLKDDYYTSVYKRVFCIYDYLKYGLWTEEE